HHDDPLSRSSQDPAPTLPYPLSLHDALPIYDRHAEGSGGRGPAGRRLDPRRLEPRLPGGGDEPPAPGARIEHARRRPRETREQRDRKSTRLNSSHRTISYAVFCLKKKNKANA